MRTPKFNSWQNAKFPLLEKSFEKGNKRFTIICHPTIALLQHGTVTVVIYINDNIQSRNDSNVQGVCLLISIPMLNHQRFS